MRVAQLALRLRRPHVIDVADVRTQLSLRESISDEGSRSAADQAISAVDAPVSFAPLAGRPSRSARDVELAAVGDFQGDGSADLFWRNPVSGQSSWWFMCGPTKLKTSVDWRLVRGDWTVLSTNGRRSM